MKNFIFDVDRTLIDSYNIVIETLREALLIVTGKTYDDSIMDKVMMLTTKEFFSEIGISKNKEVFDKFNYTWGKLLSERTIKLFDGIKEQLCSLKEKGCFLGIVTSRKSEELDEVEELIKNIYMFDCIVTSDLVSKPKPDPESIILILEKFNLNKDETIYIGDSPSDFIAARQAGISFGYARWENKNQEIEADFILNNTQEIENLIKK